MDLSTILTFTWVRCCIAVLAIAVAGWLFWKLYLASFHRLQHLFNFNADTDEKKKQQLSLFAWGFAILSPIWILASTLWVKFTQNQKEICGIVLGHWVPVLYLACNVLLFIYFFRLLAFFGQCYQMRQDNEQRPVRPIIKFMSVMLTFFGFIFICAVLTKERPVIFLSTVGGALALFIFAFQNLISSVVSNFQVHAERILKVGDWVVVESKGVDGIVESIDTMTIKIRKWDKSLLSFPIRLLQEETLVNYQSMAEYGARQIKRSLLIDQRSIRFLTAEEVAELKKLHLVNDEMLTKADAFPETDTLAGEHCWTNIELFTLYAEDYLRRRPDIRHDVWCFVRAKNPTSTGLELELVCFSTRTPLVDFAPIQRALLFHLLAILPSFGLRIFQRCSDSPKGLGDVPDKIESAFHGAQLKSTPGQLHASPGKNQERPELSDQA